MIRRPPRSTHCISSAASDVYKRQDSSYPLDLYVSASTNSCVLRVASTNQHFLKLVPQLDPHIEYKIFKVLLSVRGYLVVQARNKLALCKQDLLLVFSINGEEIARTQVNEFINAILLDPYQYFIVRSIQESSCREERRRDLRGTR
eukprot:TRINITY_DN4959_c0_g2_i1.p1 TRINITY_DN4959_c0_g2~~TRINITY_DN4959_c0_g2_i1.p1  ORF type:complete len:154 (+),score=34.16 TRINITY_DN4959_c0_g2_i1:25-462(+)